MFEMKIDLFKQNVHKARYSLMKIDDIYEYLSVEGNLTIIENKQLFFSEDIAVIEFYWYITKWYKADGIKQKNPFRYTTVEYIEPILTFSFDHGNLWIIDSPWKTSHTHLVVEEHTLESQVQKLIDSLAETIEL